MTTSTVHRRRGLGARLVPLIIALGALPLMAPTCGTSGEGVKVFSRRSLIIPMDVCFQYMTDGVRGSYTPAGGTTACPAVDQGDVIKAYGLVYQLIRNGIAVYWVIDDAKTAVDGVDLTLQYQGGFPVYLFDWATGLEGAAPAASLPGDKHTVNYRGGPFVVDGSDYDRAAAVLQRFRSTFGSVNVHVSNVAFRGYSKRTMAGGWSAGGAVAPKLALLDIGSSIGGTSPKNSEVVIQGYLTRAGLDTPGAAGTSAPGNHGEIYDRLFMADFVPTVAGDWTRTELARNQYQILWVPHWAAPGSCSDCPPSTSCTCQVQYPDAEVAAALRTIGSFVTTGRGDLFAECSGIGSFEGVFSSTDPSTTGYSASYVLAPTSAGGEPTTHFHTENTTGVWINKSVSAAYLHPGNFASPLMQIGDYPFIPRTGAIQNFKANDYRELEVVRLISENTSPLASGVPSYDVFTYAPGTGSRGSVVYLGGHSYSGTDGAFEVAGARLVLNTLFNLGAACTASDVACSTGLPGVCATGRLRCNTLGEQVCVQTVFPNPLGELCNGLDDDCDGQVDEDLQRNCYEPPPGYVDPDGRTTTFLATQTQGVCRPGISVCQKNPDGSYGMSACTGQVLPTAESCNGLDDDCDTVVDDGIAPISCYSGPPITSGVGECRPGTQVCQNGQFGGPAGLGFVVGACTGEVIPRAEVCTDAGAPGGAKDDDCDGVVNNGCTCTVGTQQSCFSGPGTAGTGVCVAGTQTCTSASGSTFWGACTGQIVATTESCVSAADWASLDCANYPSSATCKARDVNCDGRVTQCPECTSGQTAVCDPADLPALPDGSSWTFGQCSPGTKRCTTEGKWGACAGYVLPATDLDGPVEYCDGKDNDCDGAIDENAICPVGDACIRGVCVPATCGTERPPPEGYDCSAGVDPQGNHTTVSGACGDTAGGCPVGQVCSYGNCLDPCPVTTSLDPVTLRTVTVSAVCGQGTVCGGGACLGGNCYEWANGCPDTLSGQKQLCLQGACQPDPCDGKLCPSGTFCRQGDCVQACTFVACKGGERCGQDGFCEPDPCAGRTCGPGQKCTGGVCAADPCLGKGCAVGQICVAQGTTPVCIDDPCTGVSCPAGACAGGQCFRSGNLTGAGTAATTESSSGGGCGCGSGSGIALPGLLALLAAPLARRRRRGAAGGRGALLLVLVSVALVAAACKEKKTESQFDPASCAATCPGEERCIDIATDPSHCGATVAAACGHACAGGEQCVDGVCGPSSQVAPFVRSLSPASAAKDTANLAVSLAGDRFQPSATLRVTVGSSTRSLSCGTAACTAAPCCQWVSTAALAARLDLTGASPAVPWALRVVNPDGVISNSRSLAVVVPTPTVAGVSPSAVPSGSATVVQVSGSGFTAGSRCHLFPVPGVGDLALTTTLSGAGGTQLDCVVDASAIPPVALTLTVVSEPDGSGATHASNGVALTVTPSDPVITAVDPTSATGTARFLISGARFDLRTARVLFGANPLDPAFVTTQSESAILVHDLPVGSGTPRPDGIYTVAVRNGAVAPFRTSNGVSFSVGGAQAPRVDSFTTSPAPVFQGEPSVALTFTGANFPAGVVIELQPPGSSTWTALTTPSPTATSATATRSFVGAAEGQWSARLRFGPNAGDAASAAWPLRVLSNQAILRDYAAAPDPSQAGTSGGRKDSLTFQVSNIRGPVFSDVRVLLVDPSGVVTQQLTPSPVPDASSTQLVVPTGLSLVGRDTGTYAFKVLNPNATPSNALPFAITPGFPVLASACAVSGATCVNHLLQQDAPVTIRLTGTNFAKPDSNGANGSQVMAAADFMGGFPDPQPCDTTVGGTQFQAVTGTVSVVGPNQIQIQLDTRAAFVDPSYGTTYYLGVWNPGGPYGLQRSDCGKTVTSLPSIRLCATAACNQ